MRVGSLFSGIGGLDLGLERAGMRVVWQCEFDEYARRVLARHWPGVPCYPDVRAIGAELAPVDLLCGGFPCQPHSVAGSRKGAEDSRDLWPQCIRLVRELRPRWFLGENVPGIDSTILSRVLADLEDEGYRVAVLGVPACSVGAPHIRERRFIVAHTSCTGPRLGAGRVGGGSDEGRDTADASQSKVLRRQDGACGSEGPFASGADVPHSHSRGREGERERGLLDGGRATQRDDADGCGGADVSYSDQERRGRGTGIQRQSGGRQPADSGRHGPDPGRGSSEGPSGQVGPGAWQAWWQSEPDVGRVVDGISARMDCIGGVPIESVPTPKGRHSAGRAHRLRGLGNAVVPQVAEWIGRMIMEVDL